MHEEIRQTLYELIQEILQTIQNVSYLSPENHLVWEKDNSGIWQQNWQEKYTLSREIFSQESPVNWYSLAIKFQEVFVQHYPDYFNHIIGTQYEYKRLDLYRTLKAIIIEIWIRDSSFSDNENSIQNVIQEFFNFFDSPTITFTYLSPLLNFQSDTTEECIQIHNNIQIKKLSNQEINKLYGGGIESLIFNFSSQLVPIGHLQEFAFKGEFEETKLIGSSSKKKQLDSHTLIRDRLRQAVFALRSFKKGVVGNNSFFIRPKLFCPIPLGGDYGLTYEYIPPGLYHLGASEISLLKEHSSYILSNPHPSLQQACSRLASAAIRNNPEDKIIDAVVGLETILLHKISGGELSYRFSMNCSTLYKTPQEKYQTFRNAKALYNLRSAIVHGNDNDKNKIKISGEKVSLEEAANIGCELLRHVIKHFLPYVNQPPYVKTDDYWNKCLLGLPPENP